MLYLVVEPDQEMVSGTLCPHAGKIPKLVALLKLTAHPQSSRTSYPSYDPVPT